MSSSESENEEKKPAARKATLSYSTTTTVDSTCDEASTTQQQQQLLLDIDSITTTITTSTKSPSNYNERGRSPVQIPFLFVVKLHELLRDCEQDLEGKGRIISWTQPHGKSFKVHRPKEIIQFLLPTYFNQTKYKSFQRQCKYMS